MQTATVIPIEMMEAQRKLGKDLRQAAKLLTPGEARYLVDLYYTIQEYRKATDNQTREGQEPGELLTWFADQHRMLEDNIRRALDVYTSEQVIGRWMKAVTGIGPVIAAGILAHTDIAKAPTAGAVWRFAGLDPSSRWLGKEGAAALVKEAMEKHNGNLEAVLLAASKGVGMNVATIRRFASTDRDGNPIKMTAKTIATAAARRPWNARLKTLSWKLGESFVKVSSNDKDVYGKIWRQRKDEESRRNAAGEYADQAKAIMTAKKIGKTTDAYAWYAGCFTAEAASKILAADASKRPALLKSLAGAPGSGVPMLPPAQIHARAKRYAVKLFLSHLWETWRKHEGLSTPESYCFAHLGHAHKIEPPE